MNANLKENPRIKGLGWKVKFKRDGNIVACKLTIKKTIVKREKKRLKDFESVGWAKCREQDVFDMVFGMELALNRALFLHCCSNDKKEIIMNTFYRIYGSGQCVERKIHTYEKVMAKVNDVNDSENINAPTLEEMKEYGDLIAMEEMLDEYFTLGESYLYNYSRNIFMGKFKEDGIYAFMAIPRINTGKTIINFYNTKNLFKVVEQFKLMKK